MDAWLIQSKIRNTSHAPIVTMENFADKATFGVTVAFFYG
jgi:hypothetical protein